MIRTSTRTGTRGVAPRFARAVALLLPLLWSGAVVAVQCLTPGSAHVLQLLAAGPVIACAGGGRRQCVLLGGVCALLVLTPLGVDSRGGALGTRVGTALGILAVMSASRLISGRRRQLLGELARAHEIAAAAQRVLLRPLPRRVTSLSVAGDYLSASRGAQVGGDLCEVLDTPYGVRVILGDVRGHGLAAIGTVAALLGGFREAAHDEPELHGLLRRLDRTLVRHLRDRARIERPAASGEWPGEPDAEEFVTALLVEFRPDGRLTVLNCGHPWPYRIVPHPAPGTGADAMPLTSSEPLPPLGVLDPGTAEPLSPHRTRLLPGQALFLHTDGAEDARDRQGTFFPLPQVLSSAADAAAEGGTICPTRLVDAVRSALLRHADGRLTDDVALLALTRDAGRLPAQSCPPPIQEPDRVG